MIARSRIAVVAHGGRSSISSLVGEAPLLLRPTRTDDGVVEVQLVGGAAGPLAGDDLALDVEVGPGAALRVRAVAASYALPGRTTEPSVARIDASVGPGASLDWWPSPTVSVQGSDHRMEVRVQVHGDGQLRWVDEVVLGRHREPSGRLTVSHRVEHDGVALLAQDTTFGDVASVGVHGSARVAVTGLVHGSGTWPAMAIVDERGFGARSPLGPTTTSWVSLAGEHPAAIDLLAVLGLDPDALALGGQTV